jgi:PAS domain S-box-containing protein
MYTPFTAGSPDQHSDHLERSMAECSEAALHAASQRRAWAQVCRHHWTASVQALLRIGQAEDALRLAEQTMAENDERLRQLAQSVNDVFWIYEPQSTRFLYVSPAYEREWMRSATALYADPQEWLSPVHRDDRPLLREAFDHLASGDGYAVEYRTTLRSGEERWIAERAFPVASQGGRFLRFAGTSQDITGRKRADLELLRADRCKDEFLATLAHELRNPLEPIRSAAALLARQHVDGPVVEQKAVSVIERQVDHLTRLVDDLLDVARIHHGKIRLRSEAVRLDEVIGVAVDANRALAEESRLTLRVQVPRNDVWVWGDSVRLTQVFSNLLHNATKFSAAGGIIEISVHPSQRDKQVAVSVRDEGTGIGADLIDSVFDLFTQGEQSLARDRGGLGIGLSVVRSVIELHGGKVSVRSDGIGKGSDFVVTLPTTHAPLAVASVPIEAPHRTGRRILVVDDNRDAAESLQALLALNGHTVALAFSGQAALDQAARIQPEVVILDIGLPDISGHEVARRLREGSGSAAPLLVALTGNARERDQRDVREAEFDHHLVKPADCATLMDLVWMSDGRPPNETAPRVVRS